MPSTPVVLFRHGSWSTPPIATTLAFAARSMTCNERLIWPRRRQHAKRKALEQSGANRGLSQATTAGVIRFEHIRRGRLHGIGRLSHGERAARAAQHRDVVQPITDGDHFSGRDAVMLRDP